MKQYHKESWDKVNYKDYNDNEIFNSLSQSISSDFATLIPTEFTEGNIGIMSSTKYSSEMNANWSDYDYVINNYYTGEITDRVSDLYYNVNNTFKSNVDTENADLEEHLDFFGSYENYAKVKLDFFNAKSMKECVVNTDDFFGRELAYKVDVPCISYGINSPANVFAIDINIQLERTRFVANVMDDVVDVDVPLVGIYNVYNMLAALAVCKMLKMGSDYLKFAVKKINPIDGRFEIFKHKNKLIVIDFAHTPQSIAKLLEHIKYNSEYSIISLFGCVGYSDKDKRIAIAEVVSKYSDRVYVTSDNVGEFNFEDVVRDIVVGLSVPYEVIEDRVAAIENAFDNLKDEEVLVLIGKGAENFQKVGTRRIPYSERKVILDLLEKNK